MNETGVAIAWVMSAIIIGWLLGDLIKWIWRVTRED